MSRIAKVIAAMRNNPKDVRFADACRVAQAIGFTAKGGSGSHCTFARPGEPIQLNFQDRKGLVPAYQARQLLEMIDRYYNEKGDAE